jgi:hypothetical protein
MRYAIASTALLALLSTPVSAQDITAVYQQARPSLVQIVSVAADGRFYLGSGVALPNGNVITNCHVTQRAKRVQLFWGGNGPSAAMEAPDVPHDLCALRFPDLKRQPAILGASNSLKIGDRVYAVGFNAGNGLSYQEGEVAELYEHDGGMVIRTTAAFTHGASGGGLFDQNGRLVGILTFFRVAKDQTAYFAVPVEWIKPLDTVATISVAPLEGIPFWADEMARQPTFLQAGALEADGRWKELAVLAREWTQASPDDGQAWIALGKASLYTGQRRQAELAFQRAVDLGLTYPANLIAPAEADNQ